MGMRAACLLVGLALLVPAAVQAQNAAGDGDPATPRTPWGDPDLQGIWTNTTTTPLERPAALAGLVASRRSPSYPTTYQEPSLMERSITRGVPGVMLPGNYAMANMRSGARDVEAAAAAKRAGSE